MKQLWVGPYPSEFVWPLGEEFKILHEGSAYPEISRSNEPILAVINFDSDPRRHRAWFEQSYNQRPDHFLILGYRQRWTVEQAQDAVNRWGCRSLFEQGSGPKQILRQLETLQKFAAHKRSRREELSRSKQAYRDLEKLKRSLEAVVEERTRDQHRAKRETESRLAQMRELIRFVKELAQCLAVEELLMLLRRELRRFHRVSDPILSYRAGGVLRHLSSRGHQISEREVKQVWPNHLRIRINEPEDRQYLANEFARPFARVIAFPLPALKVGDFQAPVPAVLFVEHNLDEQAIDEFIAYVSERLQSLSIALDRMILGHDLRATSALWEKTFDNFGDPVAIVDLQFNLVRANRSFGEPVVGEKCYVRYARRSRPCVGCPLSFGKSLSLESKGQVRRDEQIHLVHSYPIRVPSGSHSTHVVNYYQNVTEELSLQSQMIHTEKMAALGHLAGHVAHELNNPLTGIRSLTQILLGDTAVDLSVKADLAEVEKGAERCQKIIHNLLSFTKGDDDRQIVDLNDLLTRTLPFLKTAMGEHHAEITKYPTPLLIKGEPHLLQQVIFNLVNNACQAMGKGGEIEISTWREEREGRYQCGLSVKDNGPGIPEDLQSRVFEPFFTTKAEGEGTGLGLSLSRKIVEDAGGQLVLQSHPGEGASFSMLFPENREVEE